MEFPAYLPEAVRKYVTAMIDGDILKPHGWAMSLSLSEKTVIELEQIMEHLSQHEEFENVDFLRKRYLEAVVNRDWFAREVDCLRGLIQDERMQEVYALLTGEFLHDQQWIDYISSSWGAMLDFSKYRKRLKQAEEALEEISVTAEKLANLISQFSGIGVNGPDEFYSTPSVTALLQTMASVARKFKPSEDGCIGAAISSRKNNPKIEYLRAFGYLLTVYKFKLTKTMKQAMAITANVVINDPDVDVTYEDVQYSLSTMKIERDRTF